MIEFLIISLMVFKILKMTILACSLIWLKQLNGITITRRNIYNEFLSKASFFLHLCQVIEIKHKSKDLKFYILRASIIILKRPLIIPIITQYEYVGR